MAGGSMHGKGACMGVVCGRGACMARGVCSGGGSIYVVGCVCVAGGMHGGVCVWWWERVWQGDVCVGETATEAGGTHPIGMHSCYLLLSDIPI